MIRNAEYLKQWEDELLKKSPANFYQNLKLVEEILKEACSLGVFPPSDPWEDFEIDLKIARAINAL